MPIFLLTTALVLAAFLPSLTCCNQQLSLQHQRWREELASRLARLVR